MKPKSQRKIQWGLPGWIEGLLVGGMIFLLFLIDILQNKIQDFGLSYLVTYATAGKVIPAIDVYWIAIGLFTIFAVFLFSRSIWQGRTDRKIDVIFGVFLFLGLVLIVAGSIGAFLYKGPDPVVWFYNLPQISFYHIGMAMEIIGGMYFAITK